MKNKINNENKKTKHDGQKQKEKDIQDDGNELQDDNYEIDKPFLGITYSENYSFSSDGNSHEITIRGRQIKFNTAFLSSLSKSFLKFVRGIKPFAVLYKKQIVIIIMLLLIFGALYSSYSYYEKWQIKSCQNAMLLVRTGYYSSFDKIYKQSWISKNKLQKGRIIIQLNSGLIANAEKDINKLRKDNILDSLSMSILDGHLLFYQGKLDEAKLLYQNTLNDPTQDTWAAIECYNSLGHIYLLTGEYKKAIKEYDNALSGDKNYVLAHIGKGISLEMSNKFKEASEQYLNAIQTIKKTSKSYEIYSNNRFLSLLNILHKRSKTIVDCNTSESCRLKRDIKINKMITTHRKSIKKIKHEYPFKCIFVPFESIGNNSFIPGFDIVLSDIIAQKINNSKQTQIVEISLIYGFTEIFNKNYYSLMKNPGIALNIGKFTNSNFIITGKIKRDINLLSINMIVKDIFQDKEIQMNETLKTHSFNSKKSINESLDGIVKKLLNKIEHNNRFD